MKSLNTFSSFMIAFLVAMLFAASAFAPASAQAVVQTAALAAEDYIVTTPVLNLRTGPGTGFPVLRLLTQGQRVSRLGDSDSGLWSEVRLSNGTEGWVFNAYIAPVQEVETGSSYVLIARLNLRVGPGLHYRVLRVLGQGTELAVAGRNVNSDWLLVELADGTDGWVYSSFIQTEAEIASLPVREAAGGPTNSGTEPNPQRLNLLVTIRDNVAVVDVRGFASNTDLTVKLGLPGEEANLTVATGTTAADGSARMTFEMPARWADGSAVRQENLVIVVRAADGSQSLRANIVYYR